MYKESKFNVITCEEDKKIIFNSLKNTYTELPLDYDLKNYDKVDGLLVRQGVIVKAEVDEDKSAFIKYISTINSGVLHLTIMPTMACNFRCAYCYETHTSDKMSDDIINKIIEFVKKKIKNVDQVLVSWFGGEPTLCIDVIEKISVALIDICKFYRKPYHANMTTNGYLLNANLIRRLLKWRILHYQITLDGNKDEHDSIRCLINGKGSYDKILENLYDIRDHVQFPMLGIMLRINVTKNTLLSFDETIHNFEKAFGQDERFTFLFRRVGDWGGNTVKHISDSLVDDENVLTQKLLEYKGKLRINSQVTEFSNGYGVCYAGKKNAFVIDPIGNVLKCTVKLDLDSNLIGCLEENGQMSENENSGKWIYAGGYLNYRPDKCVDCPMWANCFNNTCTAAVITDRKTSTPVCNYLEDNLRLMYKMYPNIFLSVEKDR